MKLRFWIFGLFIILGAVGGSLLVKVPPTFTSYKANQPEVYIPEDELVRDKDGKIYGRKMPDGMVYYLKDPSLYIKAKRKFEYIKENPINVNGLVGAIFGWMVCKILDSMVSLIKLRKRKV